MYDVREMNQHVYLNWAEDNGIEWLSLPTQSSEEGITTTDTL